jgi:hypothetical protein
MTTASAAGLLGLDGLTVLAAVKIGGEHVALVDAEVGREIGGSCECREPCHGPLSSAFVAGRPHRHRPEAVQHDRLLWPSDSST